MTVKVAVFDVPPADAEIVTVVLDVTLTVLTVNVAEVFPAAIVTVVGTDAEELLLDTVTVSPPVGAAALILRVPVDVFPPATVIGLSVNETNTGGRTVNEPV